MPSCPLCQSQNATVTNPLLVQQIECSICGQFRIPDPVAQQVQSLSNSERSLLSGTARERFMKGDPLFIRHDEIDSLLDNAPKRVSEKAMKLLAAIERKTEHFSSEITLNPGTDFSLAYAINDTECFYLQKFLEEQGFTAFRQDSDGHQVRMKAAGYAELEKRQQSNLDSHKALVAMNFDDEFTPLWKNQIEPGIKAAGYAPKRIDFKEHNNDIVAEILAEIRQSRFVVCDFTGQKNGVYFEAGFAKGLSLEIIWMVRADDLKNCHFNTEHFNHITWKPNDDKLSERITNRIIATIGQGPLNPE